MADFGGDGISLRGLAGQRLRDQQKKDLEEFLKNLKEFGPEKTSEKPEEKAKGGRVGLYANINRRKKLGISRPKSKSTISKEAYSNMKKGFPSRGQGKVSKVKITKQY